MGVVRSRGRKAMLACLAVVAIGTFCLSTLERLENPRGSSRLVSIQELPEVGEMCLPESYGADSNVIPELQDNNLFAAFEERSVYAAAQESSQTTETTRRPPIRYLRDLDPTYSYVAVDTRRNEVFLQDHNKWTIQVFNRLDNTPPKVARTEPKRVIGGDKTEIMFNTCIYIDPKNGDIYTVESDVGDMVIVFSEDAEGNVAPSRKLNITHRGYAMSVDEDKQELFVSIQHPPQIEVYRKTAVGDEKPLRVLQGESTRLSDSHGIAIDTKNKLLFVNNWGNISDYKTPGTGRFELPSISVYPLDANGDVSPLRVIQGPKTQLNWPGTMALDPETGSLYVANDIGNSVLVFRGTDKGDVAPARIIKGDKTSLSSPVGVFVDADHKELWVANMGNASATVYPLTANGNVVPLRTIRSAPVGKVSLKFGKTQALAYDSKREQILVPN
jgi:6-phosphogluconolactonase (cycloisomerase 2 family)